MIREREVVVKNYEFVGKSIALIMFCFFFIFFVIFLFFPDSDGRIVCCSISGGVCIFWFFMAFCVHYGSKTYDVIDDRGIKRIKKDKVLFELPWGDIEDMEFLGISGIIMLRRNVLLVFPKKNTKNFFPQSLNNYDNKEGISIRLSRREFKYIEDTFIPQSLLQSVRRMKR